MLKAAAVVLAVVGSAVLPGQVEAQNQNPVVQEVRQAIRDSYTCSAEHLMSGSSPEGRSKVRGAQSLGSRQVFRTRNDTIGDQCVLLRSDFLGNTRFKLGPLSALTRSRR
jgi:hypothetical protein